MQGPTMYDRTVSFAGITLEVDPINRERTDGSDNVMAMFEDEQPFTWEFARPYIDRALRVSTGEIGFLDMGTGSGVFALLVGKHFPGTRIIAVDKSTRAIEMAQANGVRNGVGFELRHEAYSKGVVPANSCRVIGLYPPYHLYPEAVADEIPQHARGGSDGVQEFYSQLEIASYHLAPRGVLFFNQMSWGTEAGPAFLSEFRRWFPNESLEWTNVFDPISSWGFLAQVYKGRTEPVYREYVAAFSQRHPVLYYTVGVIRRDGKGEVREVAHDIDLKGRSWEDRIALHREIAAHAWK